MTTEPWTEAGRALLRTLIAVNPEIESWFGPRILAIEAEAARSADEARQRVVDAARLRRSVLIFPDTWKYGEPATTVFEGEWVAVPREDFDALRDALAALDTEAGNG